jgi:molybdate-binding protein
VAEAAELGFLSVRREPFDLCHSQDLEQDPRLQALSDAVRCRAFQQRLGCLPGYRVEGAGEMQAVVTSQDPPLNAPAGGGLGTW